MGSDADMEDYGFEYSDDEPEEQDVDIENQYYNSKVKDLGPVWPAYLTDAYTVPVRWCTHLLDQEREKLKRRPKD
uniref:Uncharacterized protein n=1 Tax=Oryza meridionalis TaxID=40149 RepID=A0A0E0C0T2_9ORYZ